MAGEEAGVFQGGWCPGAREGRTGKLLKLSFLFRGKCQVFRCGSLICLRD